jgi:hypothetical protein
MNCHRRNQVPFYTAHDLDALQREIDQTHEEFMVCLAQYLPSMGHTIKRHRFVHHFVPTIRLLGHPKHYSSQKYESDHKKEKHAYRRSAKRRKKLVEGILHRRRIDEFLRGPSFDKERLPSTTSYAAAATEAANQLVRNGICITFSAPLANASLPSPATAAIAKSAMLLAAVPRIKEIPRLLLECLRFNSQLYTSAGISSEQPVPANTVKVVNTGTVVAIGAPTNTANEMVLQTIRASHSFHGVDWFDFVEVYKTAGNSHGEPARLQALFWNKVGSKEYPFALIEEWRWVVATNETDILSSAGCKPLISDQPPRLKVVPLEHVLRRIYVLPDWGSSVAGRMRSNFFKWDREPPNRDAMGEVADTEGEDQLRLQHAQPGPQGGGLVQ